MLCQIDQFFRFETPVFGSKEIDPLPVSWSSHAGWSPAIASEKLSIRRNVEMHGPFRPLDAVTNGFSSRQHNARQPEFLAFRCLQIVPDDFAVGIEEFVPGNLHFHFSSVNFTQSGAIGADGPDAVYLVPGPFMTEHDKVWVGWRKLHVIEPVRAVVERLDLTALNVDGV